MDRREELKHDPTVIEIIDRELALARQSINYTNIRRVSSKVVDKRRKAAKLARKARKCSRK